MKQVVTTLLIPENIVLNTDNSVFMTVDMTENTGLRTEFHTAWITLNAVLTTLDITLNDVVKTATIKSTAHLRGPFNKLAIDWIIGVINATNSDNLDISVSNTVFINS